MIDVLLSGRLRGMPKLRTATNGTPFATFLISAPDKTGENLLCSCISFSASAIEAVQRMADGDSIAVSGEAALNEWQGQDNTTRRGLDVTVYGVLTAYHLSRKRKGADSDASDTAGE